jgi:hypothetical protein
MLQVSDTWDVYSMAGSLYHEAEYNNPSALLQLSSPPYRGGLDIFSPLSVRTCPLLLIHSNTIKMIFTVQVKLMLAFTAVAAVVVFAAPPGACDVSRAESILGGIASGRAFCSSILYPHGIGTTTLTRTATATASSSTCVTKTRTVVRRVVYTET